jgi:hypothetical protein
MDRRNFSKSDATPAVSDCVSVAELKRSPLAVNAKRELNVPPRRGPKSHTPPSCPRFSEFNTIHSRDGD